jgi:hypothetical protein
MTLDERLKVFLNLKATTLYPGGIRSHDPWVQSPRRQAQRMPLDHAVKARLGMFLQDKLFNTYFSKSEIRLTSTAATSLHHWITKNQLSFKCPSRQHKTVLKCSFGPSFSRMKGTFQVKALQSSSSSSDPMSTYFQVIFTFDFLIKKL